MSKLSDKVWVTRKVRIHSEKRLKYLAFVTKLLTTTYSIILVILSVTNLLTNNQDVNLYIVIGSITVLVFTIFLNSEEFTERSIAMRICYIRLDEIYAKLQRAEDKNDLDLIKQLESEYASTILNIENHTSYDYLCLRFSERNNSKTTLPKFTRPDLWLLIWEKTWRVGVLILLFALPILAIVFYNLISAYVGS